MKLISNVTNLAMQLTTLQTNRYSIYSCRMLNRIKERVSLRPRYLRWTQIDPSTFGFNHRYVYRRAQLNSSRELNRLSRCTGLFVAAIHQPKTSVLALRDNQCEVA